MFSYTIVFTVDRLPVYVAATSYKFDGDYIVFLNAETEDIFRVTANKVLYIERSDI